jgi:hypothetical protein
MVYLQINMVKYDGDWEITNICKNLQFFTDMLLFIYIRSTSNIYWFIGIQNCCQWIQMNSYSVTFNYSQYLVQYSMNNPEGKKQLFTVTYNKLVLNWFKVSHLVKNFCWREGMLVNAANNNNGWSIIGSLKKTDLISPFSVRCTLSIVKASMATPCKDTQHKSTLHKDTSIIRSCIRTLSLTTPCTATRSMTTLSITTLSINTSCIRRLYLRTLSIMALSIMTLSMTIPCLMTQSIRMLSIMTSCIRILSKWHSSRQHLSFCLILLGLEAFHRPDVSSTECFIDKMFHRLNVA